MPRSIRLCFALLFVFTFLFPIGSAHAGEPILRDGDRVLLLGGAFIERMQTHNYLESALSTGLLDQRITFRNLGWSGDDVFGSARAVFGEQEDGFRRLRNDLFVAAPTLIFVAYGGNEAHAGEKGLPRFSQGLTRLLDMLQETKARIVIFSPYQYEHLGPPLPDPRSYNQTLRKYCKVLQDAADKRGCCYLDLFAREKPRIRFSHRQVDPLHQWTSNGVHFSPYGYWRMASRLASLLGVSSSEWRVDIDAGDLSYDAQGAGLTAIERTAAGIKFAARDDALPLGPPPPHSPRGAELLADHGVLQVRGLSPGRYGLQIDGRRTIAADHQQWAAGVRTARCLSCDDQLQQLRQTIREKNELFFHRYRPQNETYLFLFRKHEQGNNVAELVRFDPLIKEKEKQIDKLRRPRTHVYELIRLR